MSLRLAFGETEVHVSTSATLSRLLAATHSRYRERRAAARESTRTLSVRIAVPDSSPEYALRGAQREIAGEVAGLHGMHAADAVVLERDGRSLALTGSSGSGKSTIAAHLMSRGWRLISDAVAFVDGTRGMFVGHHTLMMFRSGALPHLPAVFRPSLERSRWFVDKNGELEFYEVDPVTAFGDKVWSKEATIDSVIVLDDARRDATVHTIDPEQAQLQTLKGQPLPLGVFRPTRAGSIGLHFGLEAADHIEAWYGAHVTA